MTAVSPAVLIEPNDGPAHRSSMTVCELCPGVEMSEASTDGKQRVERAIEAYPIVDPDRTNMGTAGRMDAALDRSGRSIGDDADVIVGATGVVREEPVPARNVDRFDRAPDLVVGTYQVRTLGQTS